MRGATYRFTIVAIAFVGCGKSQPATVAPWQPTVFDYKVMMEKFATDRLKAPSTARFAPHREWHVKKTGDDSYRLIGWIDAQNTFGAQIRQSFVGEVKYVGGDKFELLSLEFLEWIDSETLAKIADLYETFKAAEAEEQAKKLRTTESDGIVYLKDLQANQLPQRNSYDRRQRLAEERRAAAKADEDRLAEARRIDEGAAERRLKQQEELAEEMRVIAQAAEDAKYRTWTSASGRFTFEAQIKIFANGVVSLESRDGTIKKVPLDKLSDDDHEFVKEWRKSK